MSQRATGPFDVKMIPQSAAEGFGDPAIGRFALDKRFHGDLDATSKGEMLAHRTSVATSAGYVAMERVDGKLAGKRGAFVLQHSGTASAVGQSLTCTVVPDSGTDELTGLSGSMKIIVADGKHSYEFDYAFGG